MIKNWFAMDIENPGDEEYDIQMYVKKNPNTGRPNTTKAEKMWNAFEKETSKMDANTKDQYAAALEILLYESLNENDSSMLNDMFKALSKSKNFKTVEMIEPYDKDDWKGKVIKIESKLKGESQYHTNDFDEFEIGIEHDGGISIHYLPSGNDTPVSSVKDVLELTRANQ